MIMSKRLKFAALVLPVLAACGGGAGDSGAAAGSTSAMKVQLPAGSAAPELGGLLMSGGSATAASADANANANANAGVTAPAPAAGPGSLITNFLAGLMPPGGNAGQILDPSAAANTAVPKPASCDVDDNPEKGQQGQTSVIERFNGANKVARSCNLKLVGQYQGEGTTWYSTATMHKDGPNKGVGCKYFGTASAGINFKKSQGVQVVDATDPYNPKLATNLGDAQGQRGAPAARRRGRELRLRHAGL